MRAHLLRHLISTVLISVLLLSALHVWAFTGIIDGCATARHQPNLCPYLGLYRGAWWNTLAWFTGEDWMTEARIPAALRPHAWLANQSTPLQSLICLSNPARCSRGIVRGDFGFSWRIRGYSVLEVLQSRWGPTLALFGAVVFVASSLALCLGLYTATHSSAKLTAILYGLFSILNALPTFWFSFLLITLVGSRQALFTQWFHWPFLPPGNFISVRIPDDSLLAVLHAQPRDWVDYAAHAFLPFTVLTLFFVARLSPTATNLLRTALRQAYIQTARAKGVSEYAILYRHALRNTLRPLAAVVVQQLPYLLGQFIVVEAVFNWPGAGLIYFYALSARDLPLIMAWLFFALLGTGLLSLLGTALTSPTSPTHTPIT